MKFSVNFWTWKRSDEHFVKIRQKDCVSCQPVQHTAVLGDERVSRLAPRVEPGPIAIMPGAGEIFTTAVTDAGGVIADLDENTRGLIWLSYSRAHELADILAANPQVSWVQLPWAGVDAFAETIASNARPDRVFTSAKGAYAQPVAEHAFAMILASLRIFPRRVRAQTWETEPMGISLYGKNVTIIGAGGIARELIRLMEPFNVNATVVRRSSDGVPGADKTVTTSELQSALAQADVVVVAAALTAGTRHLIAEAEFAVMKKTAVLVNIARGPLVSSEALSEALEAGEIYGAAIDVTDPEPLPDGHRLWSAPNLLITPHQADTPEMVEPLLAERIRRNVEAFLGGTQFIGVVDTEAGY